MLHVYLDKKSDVGFDGFPEHDCSHLSISYRSITDLGCGWNVAADFRLSAHGPGNEPRSSRDLADGGFLPVKQEFRAEYSGRDEVDAFGRLELRRRGGTLHLFPAQSTPGCYHDATA